MSETTNRNQNNEQVDARELSLEEMDNIAGGTQESNQKRNQEQADK
jgi:hypothetical protein